MHSFEEISGKFTDKIIELAATEVAKIDDSGLEDGENPKTMLDLICSIRATLITIRNNTLLLETAIEKAIQGKSICTRGPVDQ